MAKTYFNNFIWYSHFNLCTFILLFVCISPSFALNSTEACECYFCVEENAVEESIDYKSLGEFEEIFREFERQADEEESVDGCCKKGFFGKWCKKLNKWFKKKVVKVLKKTVDFKKIRNSEDCAHTIAKFKRKVDKKLYKTGDIEKMLSAFDEHTDDVTYKKMGGFKDRIRFYYHNKNAKPPKKSEYDSEKYEHVRSQTDSIPNKALWGGVEFACGWIIYVIPFPGCNWLGSALMGDGIIKIMDAYVVDVYILNDNQNDEQPPPLTP